MAVMAAADKQAWQETVLSTPIVRACFLSLAVAMCVGCRGESEPTDSPTESPTAPTAAASVHISNLRVRQIGLDRDLCPSRGIYYKVWDELVFDYQGATEQQISGASLSYLQPDGLRAAMGAIGRCQGPADPCSNGGICLLDAPGTSGTVRAVVNARWQPSWTWNVRVDSLAPPSSSNALLGTIERPDQLPSGDKAVFISLKVTRSSGTSGGSFDYVIYSPGLSGRVIMHRLRVLENGTPYGAGRNDYYSSSESSSSAIVGSSGGLSIPSGPFDATADFIERDASGATVSTGSTTVHVP